MKQVLSKDQVNTNLNLIKKDKAICYKIQYNKWTNDPTFYIWFRTKGIAVAQGKKLYWHPFGGTQFGIEDNVMVTEFSGISFIEYIPTKTYHNQPKDDTKEKILKACGLMAEKQIKEVLPEQRLKQLDSGLDKIYKMMIGLQDISGDLVTKYHKSHYGCDDKDRPYLALIVTHSKGSFSFPFEDITAFTSHNEEIQNIFFNALNLPVTSKMKVA